MREDHSSNVVVVDLEVVSAIKDALSDAASGSDGHWSQSHLVGDISDGVYTRDGSVLELVNFNGAAVKLDASILEGERSNIRRAAKSNKALVAFDSLTRLESDKELAILLLGH